MQYTENYNLNKPELTDVADITKLSDNMDIIDEELEKRTTKSGFLTDLITHLASDAAIAISSLSTDSVFYRLLSYALNAAGVQYNFQNSSAWYICLGALFGGLIIQGGISTLTVTNTWVLVALPITYPTKQMTAYCSNKYRANFFSYPAATEAGDSSNIRLSVGALDGSYSDVSWLSVGR